MITECRFTPSQVREMTLAEANALFEYWSEYPPPSVLLTIIARCLGWKPKDKPIKIIEGTAYEAAAAPTKDWFANPARFFRKKDEEPNDGRRRRRSNIRSPA